MRNATIFFLCLLFPLFLKAQTSSSQDSIQLVFEEIFEQLESDYLFRKKVDWKKWKEDIYPKALQANSLADALTFSTQLFDSIGCNHCMLFSNSGFFQSSLNKALQQEDFSRNFLLKYEQEPGFETKIIQDSYAYVLIPGMLLLDADRDSLDRVAQHMYDEMLALSEKREIKGWIIDLRFNIGGNVYPMLASLYHLLGDAVAYTELDENNKLIQRNHLEAGAFYTADKQLVKVNPSDAPDLKTPIAIITGKLTGSAGEDVAIAFKGRENTLFLGEESYGFLTGNEMVEIPYDAKMAFTTCFIADKNRVYRETVKPDNLIEKGDNFEQLEKDENVIRALQYFNSWEKE